MKKNAKLRIVMDSEQLEKIRKLATEQKISMSLYCLKKINTPPELARIENMLLNIENKVSKIKDAIK